jgi:hypothetical protein
VSSAAAAAPSVEIRLRPGTTVRGSVIDGLSGAPAEGEWRPPRLSGA